MNNIVFVLVIALLIYDGFGNVILGLLHVKKSSGEYGSGTVFVGMLILMLLIAILFIP